MAFSFRMPKKDKEGTYQSTTALKKIAYLFVSMQVLFKEIFQLGLVVWQLLGIYVADVLLEEKQNRSVTLDCFYYLQMFYALTIKMEAQ